MAKQRLIPYEHVDLKTGDRAVWDHYYFDPKTQIIYFRKSHNGKKIKFSTFERVPNGVKAKRFANAEFDRRTGKNNKHVRTTLSEEIDAWLLFKESEGWKPDTMNNIRRAGRQIREFWGSRFPRDISRDSFAEWNGFWQEKHSDIDMENAVKYFNNLCGYLHEKVVNDRSLMPARLRFNDPNRKVIKARRARKKERVFTQDEFKKIFESAPGETEALITLIMYTMATRIDETLRLDFGRILLDLEVPVYRWTVDQNKAELVGEHDLHPSLVDRLMALKSRRRMEGTSLLFPQKNDNQKPLREQQIDWDGWRKRAKIDWHWTPHTFKHTCLTNLFNDPKNPQAVICKLYRCSLGVALDTYVKVTREARTLMRSAIEVSL